MKAYRVKGQFLKAKRWHSFSKEAVGENEEQVREQMLSTVGSNHRVKRRNITIHEITELAPDQVENPVVKYRLEV